MVTRTTTKLGGRTFKTKGFPRPCNRCGKRFIPTGVKCRVCLKCIALAFKNRKKHHGK